MEKKENILWVKGTLAALCGAFTAAFGWLGWLVLAWAACMALDWVSGSAAAASKGQWSSGAASRKPRALSPRIKSPLTANTQPSPRLFRQTTAGRSSRFRPMACCSCAGR